MPNFDEKTGIRYGVISPHTISPDALNDIDMNGTDPHYETGHKEIEEKINAFFEDLGFCDDDMKTNIRDEILQSWSDRYENPDGQMDYSDKEYDLHVSGDNFGIFVMRSPYYTYCRNCSPCAPGAGDLDSPIDPDEHEIMEAYHRALCLGPEWFDKPGDEYARAIPYRVFRVDDDQEVI